MAGLYIRFEFLPVHVKHQALASHFNSQFFWTGLDFIHSSKMSSSDFSVAQASHLIPCPHIWYMGFAKRQDKRWIYENHPSRYHYLHFITNRILQLCFINSLNNVWFYSYVSLCRILWSTIASLTISLANTNIELPDIFKEFQKKIPYHIIMTQP